MKHFMKRALFPEIKYCLEVFLCSVRTKKFAFPLLLNIPFVLFNFVEKIGGAFGAGEEDNEVSKSRFPGLPEWLDLNIIVPTIATVIVICVGIIIVCAVCVITKRRPQMTPGFETNHDFISSPER